MYKYPSVMTVAGFDPSGGAGIQADIKTISALGCYATSALTALPVQNTCGVQSIHPVPVEVVAAQMRAIVDDIPPDAIKIGMVHSTELVDTIAETLAAYGADTAGRGSAADLAGQASAADSAAACLTGQAGVAGAVSRPGWGGRVVFDPVMVATSGHKLIEDKTISAIIERLFPLAAVITPNMDEAAVLAGMAIETVDDMRRAGERILRLGCNSLLLKGGHLKTRRLTSLFFDPSGGESEYHSERLETCNTHGSGCTLSSAIASYLARGEALADAVRLAQEWVTGAIAAGADVKVGRGNGPLNHFYRPEPMMKFS